MLDVWCVFRWNTKSPKPLEVWFRWFSSSLRVFGFQPWVFGKGLPHHPSQSPPVAGTQYANGETYFQVLRVSNGRPPRVDWGRVWNGTSTTKKPLAPKFQNLYYSLYVAMPPFTKRWSKHFSTAIAVLLGKESMSYIFAFTKHIKQNWERKQISRTVQKKTRSTYFYICRFI